MTHDPNDPSTATPPRPIEYVAPPDDVFTQFARAVCQERARLEDDPRLLAPEVAAGLAAFLKLAAVLEARRLNRARGGSVDSGAA